MAMLETPVDTSNLPDRPPVEILPVGDYLAMIVESDVKPTSAGTGTRISLTWEIIDGEYTGRKVFHGINYANPNPKAEQIGKAELKAVCQAVGKLTFQDTQELHGIPAVITLKIKPADANYDARNEIRTVRHKDAPAPTRGAARPAPAAGPVAQSGAVTPATSPTPTTGPVSSPAPTGGRPGPAAQPWKR